MTHAGCSGRRWYSLCCKVKQQCPTLVIATPRSSPLSASCHLAGPTDADCDGDRFDICDPDRPVQCTIQSINPTAADAGNTTIIRGHVDPVPKPGFWSSFDAPDQLIACLPPEACLGGKGSPCAVGYKGRRCGFCEAGFWKDGNYCGVCPSNGPIVLTAGLVVVCAFAFVIGKYGRLFIGFIATRVLSHWLLVTLSLTNFDINWPAVITNFFDYIRCVRRCGDTVLTVVVGCD